MSAITNQTLDEMREAVRNASEEHQDALIEICLAHTPTAVRMLNDGALALLAMAGNYGLLEARNRTTT